MGDYYNDITLSTPGNCQWCKAMGWTTTLIICHQFALTFTNTYDGTEGRESTCIELYTSLAWTQHNVISKGSLQVRQHHLITTNTSLRQFPYKWMMFAAKSHSHGFKGIFRWNLVLALNYSRLTEQCRHLVVRPWTKNSRNNGPWGISWVTF
jgi:hypothetical protein